VPLDPPPADQPHPALHWRASRQRHPKRASQGHP